MHTPQDLSPLFDNFLFVAELHTVLRPQSSIASITLWSLYCEDHLAHGAPYDIGRAFPKNLTF
uniref:Uncharacterized protein n=1 Tax=Gongylonema pulchrum TaxID=637853 RepID=A0A183DC09_9BILA